MSDQVDAFNKVALEAGIVEQTEFPAVVRPDDGDPDRPNTAWVQLPVDGRINSDFNAEVGRIVAGKGLYRHKGVIVTVGTNEKTGRVEIEEMDAHDFRTWIEREGGVVCYRHKFNRDAGVMRVKQTMGVDIAQTCLRDNGFRRLQPQLVRVNSVRLPIRRASGRIELLPVGYDAESCILTMGTEWDYDEEMSAAEAKHILENLVREFPFQEDRSRAVFFAGLLSQFGYFLQPLDAKRLNFLFHANAAGSGKTLLVEIILTLPWLYAAVDGMPDDTGKLRDRLDTAVREAAPYVVFDDLDQSYLRSGMLNAYMTATWWAGRKFHSQEQFMEPKSAVVFFTGNNLDVSPDIARRTLTCDLFCSEADVQSRVIESDIEAEWLRQPAVHSQLCSALWALIRSWRDAGRSHTGRLIKGYESWSRLFGGIAMHAGFGDPCAARETDGYGNTEYSDMLELVSALAQDVVEAAEYEFADIVSLCRELNCFGHLVKGKVVKASEVDGGGMQFIASDDTNASLGKLLGRYGGKAFVTKAGKRVIFDKRGKNRHRRYVIAVVS